ncbi:conserved hypothetical protein [Rhodococcus phage E3]|uniref:minor tail protein n=1 Tax=Rhodococcus phage E3 TaxID=1007869 RepID=UPI0002C6DEE5|nr:minor tail protein [Rhodococcus phage E3]AEQ21127.1 conserved hypothetical protein [Rhodococcus phage E3]
MPPLKYVGRAGSQPGDLAIRSYVDPLLDLNPQGGSDPALTEAQVDSLITTSMDSYVTQAYVDSGLNSGTYLLKSALDGSKTSFVAKSPITRPNGPAALDADGCIVYDQYPAAWDRRSALLYTASSYAAYNGSTSGTICTLNINPAGGGFYQVMVFGSFEARGVNSNARRPEIHVKSPNGNYVAFGCGRADSNYHQVVVSPIYNQQVVQTPVTLTVTGQYTPSLGTGNVQFSQPHSGANHYNGIFAIAIPLS